MSNVRVPKGYKPTLSLKETQYAIDIIKKTFSSKLASELNLTRVSAPLMVYADTGMNDNLNGIERPVEFEIKESGKVAQVVHSLAKWKRMALWKYEFTPLTGLYTDMNAIRRDEELDNFHSIYVDQWDWEIVIDKEHRTKEFLKDVVRREVAAIVDTSEIIKALYPEITLKLEKEVTFVTTQELEDLYPNKTSKERENLFVKEHKTVFIMEIGDNLNSGEKHDGRAPDYDDWKLNGDIMFYNELLGCAVELSSMGIRVDKATLESQLKKANCEDRKNLLFHKLLLNGTLPLTLGGGIGQSRLCMLLLQKAHIGEVQVSLWDNETLKNAKEAGITIL